MNTENRSFSIWAIADLHLSFGTPNKEMDVFGEDWTNWTEKIQNHWRNLIQPQDLVLIAGDISWAMHIDQVIPDLEWIDKLPGTKVMIRGNHDYWWESRKKIANILPSSIKIIQNDVVNWNNISIGGARLWDTPEYQFGDHMQTPKTKEPATSSSENEEIENAEKIFVRELNRLEMSLKNLDPQADLRIAMTHYPPIGVDMQPSRTSAVLEKYGVNVCVFGHLHGMQKMPLFSEKNGIKYYLTSCDYLDFTPIKIY